MGGYVHVHAVGEGEEVSVLCVRFQVPPSQFCCWMRMGFANLRCRPVSLVTAGV